MHQMIGRPLDPFRANGGVGAGVNLVVSTRSALMTQAGGFAEGLEPGKMLNFVFCAPVYSCVSLLR